MAFKIDCFAISAFRLWENQTIFCCCEESKHFGGSVGEDIQLLKLAQRHHKYVSFWGIRNVGGRYWNFGRIFDSRQTDILFF
jgi:hypothetical protein